MRCSICHSSAIYFDKDKERLWCACCGHNKIVDYKVMKDMNEVLENE